ncbi:MAG: YkgJ family cysteine cluster protein [Chloroflexota bacterium]
MSELPDFEPDMLGLEFLAEPKTGYKESACFRCGECCRYHVFLSADEANRISGDTGLPIKEFAELTDELSSLEPEIYILLKRSGECIFLEHGKDNLTRCLIQEVKPRVCRDFVPSLNRIECQRGLKQRWRLTVSDASELQGSPEDVRAFLALLKS